MCFGMCCCILWLLLHASITCSSPECSCIATAESNEVLSRGHIFAMDSWNRKVAIHEWSCLRCPIKFTRNACMTPLANSITSKAFLPNAIDQIENIHWYLEIARPHFLSWSCHKGWVRSTLFQSCMICDEVVRDAWDIHCSVYRYLQSIGVVVDSRTHSCSS